MTRNTDEMADEQADDRDEDDDLPQKQEDWDPEPATLREGETEDTGSHAERNLAMIREGVESGVLDEDALERAKERYEEGEHG